MHRFPAVHLAVLGLLIGGCSAREPAAAAGPPVEGRRDNDPARWKPGEVVTTRGRISTLYEQHIVTSVDGKKEGYFDIVGHGQTIVYWRSAPSCPGDIEVTGKVLEVRARGKQVGQRESKADDQGYREVQIDVLHAECIE